jgi:hypothetical protein
MMSKATSPGIMFMSRKMTNAAPSSVGIISNRRLTIYCHIASLSLLAVVPSLRREFWYGSRIRALTWYDTPE